MVWHRFTASIRGLALVAVAGYAVLAACQLAAPFVAVVARPLLADGPGGLDTVAFDDALAGLSAVVLLGCVLWLSLTTALTVAVYVARELAPGTRLVGTLGRAVERSCPAAMGRLVALVLGVAVTVGFAGPALGQDGPGDPGPAHPRPLGETFVGSERLSGLPLPDRPAGAGWTVQMPPDRPEPDRPATSDPVAEETAAGDTSARDVPVRDVVVRPGQSLWTIADGLLPAPATDAQITRAWQHLARANTSVIGADPDLILPGTRLVVPDLDARPDREEAP